MNKEIQDQWLTALRSGEYEQGVGVLQYNGKFCCLGVLCELAVKAGVVEAHKDEPERVVRYQTEGHSDWGTGVPPRSVADWAGMNTKSGIFTPPESEAESLTNLNDSGFTFNQIADVIERFGDAL